MKTDNSGFPVPLPGLHCLKKRGGFRGKFSKIHLCGEGNLWNIISSRKIEETYYHFCPSPFTLALLSSLFVPLLCSSGLWHAMSRRSSDYLMFTVFFSLNFDVVVTINYILEKENRIKVPERTEWRIWEEISGISWVISSRGWFSDIVSFWNSCPGFILKPWTQLMSPLSCICPTMRLLCNLETLSVASYALSKQTYNLWHCPGLFSWKWPPV